MELFAVFVQNILPIFIVAGIGFLIVRYLGADVRNTALLGGASTLPDGAGTVPDHALFMPRYAHAKKPLPIEGGQGDMIKR
ncbi:hypothetical protein SBDP2_1760003 [Syntrophobacter sp. SbD2]|nr:hypothetical protein SBDP2_1760003 [Syntrophobacter sp. SbD2]